MRRGLIRRQRTVNTGGLLGCDADRGEVTTGFKPMLIFEDRGWLLNDPTYFLNCHKSLLIPVHPRAQWPNAPYRGVTSGSRCSQHAADQ